MTNREDYIRHRQEILSGRLPKDFIPYMYEYYLSYCRERNIQPACTEEQFPDAMDVFIQTPVQVQAQPNVMSSYRESLDTAARRTMEYFDNLYKNKYDN